MMSREHVGRSFRAPTRRGFQGVTGGALASRWPASCAGERDDELAEAAAGGTDAREAPQLAEMVESGEVPPQEERLPENPLMVDQVDHPGVYGGTWHSAMVRNDQGWGLERTGSHVFMVRWDENSEEPLSEAVS